MGASGGRPCLHLQQEDRHRRSIGHATVIVVRSGGGGHPGHALHRDDTFPAALWSAGCGSLACGNGTYRKGR